MSVLLYICPLCNGVVKNGETHQCAFKKNDDTKKNSLPEEMEELDIKYGEKTEEYRENSNKSTGNMCEAAPLAEYTSQAFTSRTNSDGNNEGSSDEPLDLTNRPTLHGANSERRVDAERKPTQLQQDAGAVAGPSTIGHPSTGPGGKTQYACDSCNYQTKNKAIFRRHQRIHTGVKPYVCDTCGKGFSQSGSLTAHKRIHTGEQPYICDTCGKRFAIKQNLNVHKRLHTGEKPCVCETCGKRFIRRAELNSHMMTHTSEKPLVCETCGKAFSLKRNLNMHRIMHMSEKPFVCNTCGKGFARKDRLEKHARTHN